MEDCIAINSKRMTFLIVNQGPRKFANYLTGVVSKSRQFSLWADCSMTKHARHSVKDGMFFSECSRIFVRERTHAHELVDQPDLRPITKPRRTTTTWKSGLEFAYPMKSEMNVKKVFNLVELHF